MDAEARQEQLEMMGHKAQAWRGELPTKGQEGLREIRAEGSGHLGIMFIIFVLNALVALWLGLMVAEVVEVQELQITEPRQASLCLI